MRDHRLVPARFVRRAGAGLVALSFAATACGGGQLGQSALQVTGGAQGRADRVVVRDAAFAPQPPSAPGGALQPGSPVEIRVTVVNEGDLPDRLVSVRSPVARGGAVIGDAALPGYHVLTAGYPPPGPDAAAIRLVLTEVVEPLRSGKTYPVLLTFERAGGLRMELPMTVDVPPRPDCPLPADGHVPMVHTAPDGAPKPPVPPPPDCSSLP